MQGTNLLKTNEQILPLRGLTPSKRTKSLSLDVVIQADTLMEHLTLS